MEPKTYPLYSWKLDPTPTFQVVSRIPFVTAAVVCYQGRHYIWCPDLTWGEGGYPEEAGYIEEEVFQWDGVSFPSDNG